MHLRSLSLPALLLGASLAFAQATNTSTTTPATPTAADVTKVASTFAAKMVLLPDVICYDQPFVGGWHFCQAPVNPGITTAPTGFLCDAKACVLSPGLLPTLIPDTSAGHDNKPTTGTVTK
jgi:hypothetical protein